MNLPVPPIVALFLACLLAAPPAGADLYWCQDENVAKLVQKKIPGNKCKLVHKDSDRKKSKEGKSSREANSSSSKNFPSVSDKEQAKRDSFRRPILENELRTEIKLSELASRGNRRAIAANNTRSATHYNRLHARHLLNIKSIEQELARLD